MLLCYLGLRVKEVMISFYLNFSWVFDHRIIYKRKHNKDRRSKVQQWKRSDIVWNVAIEKVSKYSITALLSGVKRKNNKK